MRQDLAAAQLTAMSNPAAGWYQDPHNPTLQRYWDGNIWTDATRPAVPPVPGAAHVGGPVQTGQSQKVTAGILALLLGGFGVHKFYLGYTKQGVLQILLTLFTCGIGSIVPFVEGILYLTKSDEEFIATYQRGRKPWF